MVVRSLAREGTIHALRGDRAEVRLGRVLFTVDTSDLAVANADTTTPSPGRSGGTTPAPRRSSTPAAPSSELPEGPDRELKLIGRTVDEALDELDKFLDSSALAGSDEVRVIHGHGTGRLRTAVRKFLRGHTHVKSHRPGKSGEGGDGATEVVELQVTRP